MAILISNAPALHRVGLSAIFAQYDTKGVTFYKDIAKTILDSDQAFDIFIQEADFPLAQFVREDDMIPVTNVQFPYQFNAIPTKFGLGWDISTEALDTDIYGKLAGLARSAMSSMNKTRDQSVANIINNATVNTQAPYINPDGQPLASASHPLQTGATASNLLTSSFGPIALETMVQDLYSTVTPQGVPDPIVGPFTLYVHPSMYLYAQRVTGAERFPLTPNNDENVVKGHISRVVASPYFTNATAWALQTDDEVRAPIALLHRRSVKVATQMDIDKDVMKYRLTEIYTPFAKGWRGFYYSTGAGS